MSQNQLASWIRENKKVYGSDFMEWREQEITLLKDTMQVSKVLTEDSITAHLAAVLETISSWEDLEQACNQLIEDNIVRIYNMKSKENMKSVDEILKSHKEDHAFNIWMLNACQEDDVFGITFLIVAEKLGLLD